MLGECGPTIATESSSDVHIPFRQHLTRWGLLL